MSETSGQGQGQPPATPMKPKVAQRFPYEVAVKAGDRLLWCACGLSKTQPFCDASHKGTGIRPVRWVAEKDETVWFCGCKTTAGQPFCDGSHHRLPAE